MGSTATMGATIFGRLIKARRDRKITQKQVAWEIGVTRAHFCRIENGHADVSAGQLFAWANAVGVDICAQSRTCEAA